MREQRRGHTAYGENVTRTATVTGLAVMPLCRATRMTHAMRDNEKTGRREGESRVSVDLVWMFSLKS